MVHWAADAAEANRIVTRLVEATGEREVVKVKSMATQEIGLNEALFAAGIRAYETDLAELIVQLADDRPSHILVPAIHRNRGEIRDIFAARMGDWDARPPAPDRRTRRPRRSGEAAPAGEVPARQGRRSPGRTSRSRRPARWWSSSRRATGGCA